MVGTANRRMRIWLKASMVVFAVSSGSLAQQAPAPITPPASTTPPVSAPPVATPPAPAPAEAAKPAEAPKPPADGGAGEIRDVAARPVLRLKGQSTWDQGFASLKTAIATLEAETKRLSLPRDGNPLAYFVDSDDLGFTYEMMLPLAAAIPAGTTLGTGFDAAQSPGGRAVIFPNEGAYDEIDTAYEALTAWLDDKNLVSTGKFLEEYEFIPEKSDETTMKLKIVVFLK
ncbi:MAG: hypothetical protein CFE31_14065 [Rhizobiales bacterium PAR1]|nr:MAG: hypothetical protein CFE31_14065 [Rhizobiales bacterium PAR1]